MKTDQQLVKKVETLFHGTGDTYNDVVHFATWGRDAKWKEELLTHIENPKRILDLACGTGILALGMARKFDCHVTGVELRDEYLVICRERSAAEGLDTRFILSRAEEVRLDEQFDHITSCYLPKYANLEQLVPNMVSMLAPGGLWIMQDFSFPDDPRYQRIFAKHFERMTARFQDQPDWDSMWSGLPGVIRDTTWIPDLMRLMTEHGLEGVDKKVQAEGMSTMVWGRKPA